MMWELSQHARVRGAEGAARKAENKAERVDFELTAMRRHLERLSLASQAMWELIRDRTDLSEEDLEAKMLEVDGRDGAVDDKISRTIMACSNCGRNTNSRRSVCIMCGHPIDRPHKFEG